VTVKGAGVCFQRETKAWMQDQWSFCFSNFGITDIWERGWFGGDSEIYQDVIPVRTADELPGRPLVVLAPKDGRYFKGTQSLVEFNHPADAIYVFGGSHQNLTAEDLGARTPDHLVFIPTVEYEMYSHAAGYLVFYDRMVKRGGFG